MEAGGECPVHLMDSTSPTLPLDVMNCLNQPITNNNSNNNTNSNNSSASKSDVMVGLEAEIERLVAEVPSLSMTSSKQITPCSLFQRSQPCCTWPVVFLVQFILM